MLAGGCGCVHILYASYYRQLRRRSTVCHRRRHLMTFDVCFVSFESKCCDDGTRKVEGVPAAGPHLPRLSTLIERQRAAEILRYRDNNAPLSVTEPPTMLVPCSYELLTSFCSYTSRTHFPIVARAQERFASPNWTLIIMSDFTFFALCQRLSQTKELVYLDALYPSRQSIR